VCVVSGVIDSCSERVIDSCQSLCVCGLCLVSGIGGGRTESA